MQNKDSPGYDILQVKDKTIKELWHLCHFIPYAQGFNSFGWIKYYIPTDNIVDMQDCTLYKIKQNTSTPLDYTLPRVYCATDRDDVVEFLRATFSSDPVQLQQGNIFQQLANQSEEMFVVVAENIKICDDFDVKLKHVLASIKNVEWDLLSFSGDGNFNNDLPLFIPTFEFCDDAFVIKKSAIPKILNDRHVNIFTTVPHLASITTKTDVVCSNNPNYAFFLKNLTFNVKYSNISTFKTWDCLGKKGLWIYVPDDHLANTNYEKNLTNALSYFKIEDLKDPVPTTFTKENGTDALIVRNAGDFANANIDLSSYDHILEVGGGYGALANVILSSGYTGTYTIYDFKLMENIFRHYIQKPFNFIYNVADIKYKSKTLMISTWGISEMPTPLIEKIYKNCDPDGVYIIAQNGYDGRNNVDYFRNLIGIVPVEYDAQSMKFFRLKTKNN